VIDISEAIKGLESQIEQALWSFEVHGEIGRAQAAYLDAESRLVALDIAAESPVYAEQQRVLSYCLMRQGTSSGRWENRKKRLPSASENWPPNRPRATRSRWLAA